MRSADLPVPAHALQKRSDLHVAAELQHAARIPRGRDQRQCSRQTRNMLGKVLPRFFVLRGEVVESRLHPCHVSGIERLRGWLIRQPRQAIVNAPQQTYQTE